MARAKVGPEEEQFTTMYKEAGGDFYEFNQMLMQAGLPPISDRTFRRRRNEWINGMEPEKSNKPDTQDDRPVAGGTILPPDKRRKKLSGKRFVFTSAQNNTYVHEEFWNNLLRFCEDRGAQLVIGKYRYNKNGFQNLTRDSQGDDLWFDPKITPYVIDESCVLDDGNTRPVWCGELDILPTAVTPLSGFDSYTHSASSIIPHAKVQLKSVPVMKGMPPKMLYTTGTVTQRNYIAKKAGQKAEFHHVFGALYVEIDEQGDEFLRQIIADSEGSFYDLTDYYSAGQVYRNQSVTAINWGDIHAELLDKEVAYGGWASEHCMLDELDPSYQFIHDLTDFRARNHHNIKNPHFLHEMQELGMSSVKEGLTQSALALASMDRHSCQSIIVESNHDQAFLRWLTEAQGSHDPINAEYWHYWNYRALKHFSETETKLPVFESAVREIMSEHPYIVMDGETKFLSEDDSFVICGVNGIECGMHGHRGPNGARGNPNNLRNIGRKVNVGHTHSAAIIDGVYVAGISCMMDMGYNKGPSSWSHSHIITYPNGKRAIITMKNGKWKA